MKKKLKKSHNSEKKTEMRPFGIFQHHSAAKLQKNEGGTFAENFLSKRSRAMSN